ncbi:MAG: hypothetical protein IKM07_02490, partial [Clostridia bacterium]|nr:hypothetical protein [Clostridia bacterium]
MLKLTTVFASHALFQADAPLVVSGMSTPGANVCATLRAPDGSIAAAGCGTAGPDGFFGAEITTPEASFDAYTLTVSDGTDTIELADILFGELWLASGQSNMQMPNIFMNDKEALLELIRGMKIRVYNSLPNVYTDSNSPPWDPDYFCNGEWLESDNRDRLYHVSAMALKFCAELYPLLNEKRDVPIGFLNLSHGGVPLRTYLPKDAIDADPAMVALLRRIDRYPEREKWNPEGGANFQQCCAQYNMRIAPVTGCKVRGIIWYQGENECGSEYVNRIYADCLRFYYKVYCERFAAHPNDFLMISSLIYPWTYGESGECSMGYLNQAFIDTAVEAPEKFAVMPIGDLKPTWVAHEDVNPWHPVNHPIHPAPKYEQAVRMARLAAVRVYGEEGQTAPGRLISCEQAGDHLQLRFYDVGSGLRVDGCHPRCLYVAGSDGNYLPADCRITAPDTMEVWCDEIAEPVHAAYAVQSGEPMANLFADEYPLLPFFTDTEHRLEIEARPWYDSACNAVWVFQTVEVTWQDVFFRPVWKALPGSEICHDVAFTRSSEASLRVMSEDGSADFDVSVSAHKYNRLDLPKYAGLSIDLYN